MEVDPDNTETTTSPAAVKKIKTAENLNESNSQNSTHNLKKYFPFQIQEGTPCLIKVYDEPDKTNFILNDVIEVVGFLSLNPMLEANWEDTDAEDKAIHPPPSLVPRIHAIFVKKQSHCNPLVDKMNPGGQFSKKKLFNLF